MIGIDSELKEAANEYKVNVYESGVLYVLLFISPLILHATRNETIHMYGNATVVMYTPIS